MLDPLPEVLLAVTLVEVVQVRFLFFAKRQQHIFQSDFWHESFRHYVLCELIKAKNRMRLKKGCFYHWRDEFTYNSESTLVCCSRLEFAIAVCFLFRLCMNSSSLKRPTCTK